MAGKIKTPDEEKTQEFIDIWNETGGLITKAQTARLLCVSISHMTNRAQTSLHLETIKFNGKEYITFQSFYKEFKKRKAPLSNLQKDS